MCAWNGNDIRETRRSRPRPRARPSHGVQYVTPIAGSGTNSNSNYTTSTDVSSECSSDDYDRESRGAPSVSVNMGSVRRTRGMRMPRAPLVPGSPSTPSLDSSSDSPSSMASSRHYHDYNIPSPQLEPEIHVDHGSTYTGAYGYSQYHGMPPDRYPIPPPPPMAKRKPTISVPAVPPPPPPVPVNTEPNCIVAEPDSPTARRGGPKARSYLAADAPPPEAVVVDVTNLPPKSPPGPTQVEAAYHHTYPSYYPQPQAIQHHPHHTGMLPIAPEAMSMSQGWDDDDDLDSDEEDEPRYMRHSRRLRNSIRHAPSERGARPRSRSRPAARSRSRPRAQAEVVEMEWRHRHRHHRSRSRHRRHRSRSRPNHHHHHHHHAEDEESKKRTAELQAQIDALTTRLSNIMDDPYARDLIVQEGIKFDVLLPGGAAGNKA